MTHPLRFVLTREHWWGALTPLDGGSAHPTSVLSKSVANYLCCLTLTCTRSVLMTQHHSFRYVGMKNLGPQMIFISLTRQFLEDASLVTGDDRAWLEELNQRTVDLIIHKFHHPEFGVRRKWKHCTRSSTTTRSITIWYCLHQCAVHVKWPECSTCNLKMI